MGDSIGFLLVIPVLAIIAAAFHYWFHNRILAILIPTFVVPFILPLIDYFIYGEVDPFTFVAVLNGFVMMLMVSCLVSIPFHSRRLRNMQER